jgi:hypothetical protein
MLKAMIIDEENLDRCRKLLGVDNIATYLYESYWWIVWAPDESRAWTMPHAKFQNVYTVVGHAEDCLIIDRI